LTFIQKQITTSDGRWFSTRIMPYRTFDDRIDGLVITFFNISDHKKLEVELNEKRQMHNLLLNLSSDIIIKLSHEWKVVEFNKAAEIFFGKKVGDVQDKNYFQLFVPGGQQAITEANLSKILNEGENGSCKMQVLAAKAVSTELDWNVNVLFNGTNTPSGIILIAKNT
jgi:two-component system CheB/CheR fusion protein